MRWIATAGALVAVVLLLLGCGGGDESGTDPTTGATACKPDSEAQAKRAEQVADGELSSRDAEIALNTERHKCEIEVSVLDSKDQICSIEVGKALLEGRISEEQAKGYRALQERVEC